MRQVVELRKVIQRRELEISYYDMAGHAKIHGKEMTPLEDLLKLSSNTTGFTAEEDKALDKRAQQLLREQRAMRNV